MRDPVVVVPMVLMMVPPPELDNVAVMMDCVVETESAVLP